VSQEVLIVEDDRALARKLARVIEAAGYRPRMVHDGEAAMRELAKAAPDLVLLDLLLPKKDGRTILTILKSAESTSGIPVLVMSGIFRGRDHAREFEQAGAAGFLEKPFSSKELASRLQALLGPPKDTGRSDEPAERVSLADQPVAEVLWGAMQKGLSGAVHFQAGRCCKAVVLDRGEPRFIRSNVVRECLGRRLMDAGRIDEKMLQESLRRSKNSGRRQGESLVAMGALTPVDLQKALLTQAEEKLLELFGWKEGEAWTQSGALQDSLASPLEGWSPRRTILRGVEMMDPERIEARLAPYADQVVAREELQLSDDETTHAVSLLLKALQPETTMADLMEVHAPALYGLWLVGALRFKAKGATSVGGASATLEELRELRDSQARQTHFQVLGVSEDAAAAEIRSVFVKLAKRYHPDRYRGASDEVARTAAEVFARISLAQNTLCDPEAREAYLTELRSGRSVHEQRREVARIVSAEKECRRGEEFLRKRDYTQALAHFHRALELDSNEGEFHAFYGWTLFLVRREDPQARAEAIEYLERALKLAPRSPTGYYYMGQLRKACGEQGQAGKMFRKVLALRPEHVEASRELRLLQRRRKESGDSGPGGLFGFGRKKK
jgi:CheY-like chemotaxis protein/curved DNA-binding protein CbpA